MYIMKNSKKHSKKVIYLDLKINNIIIDRVADFNFLSLIISSDLKRHKHIEHNLLVRKYP